MQNKGLIWSFIVLLTLACLYQLSFSWVAAGVEEDAKDYANSYSEIEGANLDSIEEHYLDSMSMEEVYPVVGYTYGDLKTKVINLGLDLKGGMNVTLEVEVEDVVRALSSNSKDAAFNQALAEARKQQKETDKDFVTLFGEAFQKVSPNGSLAGIFYTLDNKDKLSPNDNNEVVLEFIRSEAEDAIERSFEVLRTRVNLFGVAQSNIQRLEASDRILVELPGVKNKKRVRDLLQGTAKLEFWETYENAEVYANIEQANKRLGELKNGIVEEEADSTVADSTTVAAAGDAEEVEAEENDQEELAVAEPDSTENDSTEAEEGATSLLDEISAAGDAPKDTNDTSASAAAANAATEQLSREEFEKENPLFAIMQPALQQQGDQYYPAPGPVIRYVNVNDTAQLNKYLAMDEIKGLFPPRLRFVYEAKPYDEGGNFLRLIVIKVHDRDGNAALEGDVIIDATQQFEQFSGTPEISMQMNGEGANKWAKLTEANVGKSIAIALDNYVYSFPTVQGKITGGRSSITGNFEIEEAELIANILKAGKLPAPATIVEEAVVGPSLGKESIDNGMLSFIVAIGIVLLYMIFYYSKAGIASAIALIANMFFIFGVLASTNIALTLPGIAGIVLTIGMSVDANVLIFERIREEIAAGKGIRLAVADGYKHAYSSIIDANVTTLLTGFVLWFFGTGPVEGFAKTLVIGIFTSLFSAIFITRLIFEFNLAKNKSLSFSIKMTEGAFKNTKIGFLKNRKKYYIVSSIIILAGVGSLFTKGLDYGVDFSGGRTYVVRFAESVSTVDIAAALETPFEKAPNVKTFGADNQVRITTGYGIESTDDKIEEVIEGKLYEGLSPYLDGIDQKSFLENNLMSSQKVGPTIADDIKKGAVLSVLFSLLIIFLYIVVRFRKWQYGLGALAAIFHDVMVVLAVFSIFHGLLPFSLEIDQAFIAAILTVVGYSINDTVVVFDRIREYLNSFKKREMGDVVNDALNSTLSRTVNTSLSTIFVLLMIFIFGGEVIRGFSFALLVGVIVGTYSSLCVASPVMFDLVGKKIEDKKKKK